MGLVCEVSGFLGARENKVFPPGGVAQLVKARIGMNSCWTRPPVAFGREVVIYLFSSGTPQQTSCLTY